MHLLLFVIAVVFAVAELARGLMHRVWKTTGQPQVAQAWVQEPWSAAWRGSGAQKHGLQRP